MEGKPDPGSDASAASRRRIWRVVLIAVVVILVVASAALYVVLSKPGLSPPANTPPHDLAVLVTPSAGNNTTTFAFTAQAVDDQDPASALRVRWDWQDDGTWDTSWSTTKTASHLFPTPGDVTVGLEVKDTGNLTANVTRAMTIAPPTNTPPHILGIQVVPSSGTNLTTFSITARVSDAQDPAGALQVRWDWQHDGVWDTAWSTAKTSSHRFAQPGNYVIALEVQDTGGLTANGTTPLAVSLPSNLPPQILGIDASPSKGYAFATFNFTARVTDDRDPVSAIQVRWDWQNDSVWDTPWSTNKSASHVFPQPGDYVVRLEAQDSANLTANATRTVNVSATPSQLRIGTVLSVTGALGVYGTSQQNAVYMAIAEINAAGGVFGQPILVYYMDDQTSPPSAAQAATTLVSVDRVAAIIGATGSGMCAAVLSVAASNSVFEVSPSCTSPIFSNLTLTGGWFARTAASDAIQAVVAAYHATHDLGYTYSAVLAIDNAYGSLTASAYAANFTRMGGVITAGSPRLVPFSAPDYTADLSAVLDVSPMPQTVYLIEYPPDGVTIIQDWWSGIASHPSWANVHWMFSEGVYDPSFIAALVNAGVNVTTFDGTAPALYAGINPAGYAAWAARYQTMFGSAPALFAANAYDAAYLVALAAEASGNTTSAGIRAWLRAVAGPPGTTFGQDDWANASSALLAGTDIDYEGVSGSVNVNALGDVPSAYVVWGVNSTNQLYTKEYFNETAVIGLLPGGFFATAALMPWNPALAAWSRDLAA